MKTDSATLITLLLHFGLLSIAAVGGGNSAIPEIHRQAVEVSGWLTEREFADIFAISTAAPGPNFMISTLIGYHVAGPAGALVATLGMCGPSSVLAYYVSGTWEKFKYGALAHGDPNWPDPDFGRPDRFRRHHRGPGRRS